MDSPPPLEKTQQKLGCLAYAMGGASFIPLLGVPFGIVSVVYGIICRKHGGVMLAILGGGGILFTVTLYSFLFYFGFVQRGGVYDELKSKQAEGQLTHAIRELEYYKTQHGRYPDD